MCRDVSSSSIGDPLIPHKSQFLHPTCGGLSGGIGSSVA